MRLNGSFEPLNADTNVWLLACERMKFYELDILFPSLLECLPQGVLTDMHSGQIWFAFKGSLCFACNGRFGLVTWRESNCRSCLCISCWNEIYGVTSSWWTKGPFPVWILLTTLQRIHAWTGYVWQYWWVWRVAAAVFQLQHSESEVGENGWTLCWNPHGKSVRELHHAAVWAAFTDKVNFFSTKFVNSNPWIGGCHPESHFFWRSQILMIRCKWILVRQIIRKQRALQSVAAWRLLVSWRLGQI